MARECTCSVEVATWWHDAETIADASINEGARRDAVKAGLEAYNDTEEGVEKPIADCILHNPESECPHYNPHECDCEEGDDGQLHPVEEEAELVESLLP